MYFTSGSDRAFEQLMQTRRGRAQIILTAARPERRRTAAPAVSTARTGSTSFVCMRNVPTSRASAPPLTAR